MKATKDSVLFRKAGNKGYNKEDINSYILSLSAKIEELTKENDSLVKKNEELVSNAKDAGDKLLEAVKESEELKAANEQLLSENKILARKIVEMDDEKAALYDDLNKKAGEVLMLATKAAEDIVKKVSDKASSDEIEETKSEYENRINECIDSVKAFENLPEEDVPKAEF